MFFVQELNAWHKRSVNITIKHQWNILEKSNSVKQWGCLIWCFYVQRLLSFDSLWFSRKWRAAETVPKTKNKKIFMWHLFHPYFNIIRLKNISRCNVCHSYHPFIIYAFHQVIYTTESSFPRSWWNLIK